MVKNVTPPKTSNQSKRSATHVTIACKIPQGLRIVVPGDNGEPVIDFHLHGPNSPHAVAGHGMTHVRKDQWDAVVAYYKTHSGAKWLHNESVFVCGDAASAEDKAEDRAGLNVGYNPINPNDPNERVRVGVQLQPEGARDPGEGA